MNWHYWRPLPDVNRFLHMQAPRLQYSSLSIEMRELWYFMLFLWSKETADDQSSRETILSHSSAVGSRCSEGIKTVILIWGAQAYWTQELIAITHESLQFHGAKWIKLTTNPLRCRAQHSAQIEASHNPIEDVIVIVSHCILLDAGLGRLQLLILSVGKGPIKVG